MKKAKKTKRVKKVKVKKVKILKSKLCCTKCGDCKGVSKDRMAKLIGQFGSIEDLHASYVCRKCRKEHNVRADGKLKPEKRKRNKSRLKKDENGVAQLPKWMENIGAAFGWSTPDFGPTMTFKCPEGVSKKQFNNAVKSACEKVFK